MKIGIQTWGSDGDIFPYFALANGLKKAGHTVTIIYTSADNKDYSAYAETSNISATKIHGNFDFEMSNIPKDIFNCRNPFKALKFIYEKCFDPAIPDMYKASEQLCLENDLMIGHNTVYPLAIASEKYGRPVIMVALCPNQLYSSYNSPLGINFGVKLNNILWNPLDYIIRKTIFSPYDSLRANVGLSRLKYIVKTGVGENSITLVAADKHFCSTYPDWDNKIYVCGFFNHLEPDATSNDLPLKLREFINNGEPPVYFTFGSWSKMNSEDNLKLFINATKIAGIRAIIQTDCKMFQGVQEDLNVYFLQSIPHGNVFPLCSTIVHHGGAGHTQASLLAGKPSIVVEHAADQSFWGKRLFQLNAGGKLLHRRTINPAILAREIQRVISNKSIIETAKSLGESMKNENGVETAISIIEKKINNSQKQQ